MGKIWGTIGVNNTVIDELNLRGEVLKTKVKTPEQLSYLNANEPWIVLQSGIDVNSSSETAKSYVMRGGRIGNRKFIDLSKKNNAEATYYDSSFGFRPMPGITGLTVKNRDAFGAVLEAEVQIKVWSLEDLEALDSVYFRPGFTAVLQWGWTLTWGGKLQADVPKIMEFFGSEKLNKLLEELPKYRTANQEIVLGYITNFSYSLQKDGSYNCTVKILSTGAVMEGLRISAVDSKFVDKADRADGNSDKTSAWIAPIYEAISNCTNITNRTTLGQVFSNRKYDWHTEVKETKIKGYTVVLQSSWWSKDQVEPITYISFKDLLRIINVCDLKGNGTAYSFDLADGGDYDNDYVTCPSQFSLDPYKVVIPTRITSVDGHPLATGAGEMNGTVGRIFDLQISINYVYDVIQTEIQNNRDSYTFSGYFKALLSGISKALGNLNDFDLGLDETKGKSTLYVVDRNFIRVDPLPKISASGLDTSVLSISANSEVSSEMASMISIAAQGSKNVSPVLTAWNEGLTERHPLEEKDTEKSGSETQDAQSEVKIDDFWTKAKDIYVKMFLGRDMDKEHSSTSQVSTESYLQLQVLGEQIFRDSFNKTALVKNKPAVGVFPIKVELSFRGIAGFIIGEAFSVKPGILPKKFDTWGFIVTGVEQKIDNKGWITTVRTQYFPDKLEGVDIRTEDRSFIPATSGSDSAQADKKDKEKVSKGTWNYKIFKNPTLISKTFSKDPVKFMENQGYSLQSSKGVCARGSFTYARLLVTKESAWESILPKSTTGILPSQGVVSAHSEVYFNRLSGLGYYEAESKSEVTEGELKAVTSKMSDGDVISYWGGDRGKYHTCVKRVKPKQVQSGRGWVSDFLQNNMFVY